MLISGEPLKQLVYEAAGSTTSDALNGIKENILFLYLMVDRLSQQYQPQHATIALGSDYISFFRILMIMAIRTYCIIFS